MHKVVVVVVGTALCEAHVLELTKSRTTLPKNNQLAMVRRLVADLMEQSRMSDVWEFLRPPAVIGAAGPRETLDPVAPKLSTIEGTTGTEVKDIFMSFLMSHKLIGFMNMLEKGIAMVTALAEGSLLFLDNHQADLDSMQNPADWTLLRLILKCVLAISSPTPSIMGSTKEDVMTVVFHGDPEQPKPATLHDGEDEILILFKTAINDQPFWYSRLGRYWKASLADKELAPAMAKLVAAVVSGGVDATTQAVQQLPGIKLRLRAGATKDLERVLMVEFERFSKVGRSD